MNSSSRALIVASVGWLLLTLTYFAFYYESALSFFRFFVEGALGLMGIGVIGATLIRGVRRKQGSLLAVGVVVAVVALTGWVTPAGAYLGARIKLWREMDGYQRVVDKVAEGASDSDFAYPVSIEPGPPKRIAFSWGGIIDNWRGVVYDPTGEVLKANILDRETWDNRNDPEYASVSRWFGGTLIRAQHLKGDWYLCWFT